MSPERFKHELLCYIITNIKTNNKFKNLYCKKCYNSADPILITNIFKKVLILDELNSNFIFIYGKSIDLFLEKYKIFQKSLFCLSSHKKRKKKKIRNNRSRRRNILNSNSNLHDNWDQMEINFNFEIPDNDNNSSNSSNNNLSDIEQVSIISEIETEVFV